MTNLVQHKQIQIKQQSYIENPCNKFFQYFFFHFPLNLLGLFGKYI